MDWKKISNATVRLLKSVARGDIVLKLDRFLPHIILGAVLCIVCIFVNLKFDETLVEREQNRKLLEETKISYNQKVCQLAEMRQVNNVVRLLAEQDITVAMPEKPATIVRRK